MRFLTVHSKSLDLSPIAINRDAITHLSCSGTSRRGFVVVVIHYGSSSIPVESSTAAVRTEGPDYQTEQARRETDALTEIAEILSSATDVLTC